MSVCERYNGHTTNSLANLSCVGRRTLLSGDGEFARMNSANFEWTSWSKMALDAQNLNDVALQIIDLCKGHRYEGRDLVGIPSFVKTRMTFNPLLISHAATSVPDLNIQARV